MKLSGSFIGFLLGHMEGWSQLQGLIKKAWYQTQWGEKNSPTCSKHSLERGKEQENRNAGYRALTMPGPLHNQPARQVPLSYEMVSSPSLEVSKQSWGSSCWARGRWVESMSSETPSSLIQGAELHFSKIGPRVAPSPARTTKDTGAGAGQGK